MPGRYRQSHTNNRSRFYILLSIIFVAVMYKWGLPLFMNIIAGNGAQRITNESDIIPPQSPMISALPDATNSARIVVEGYTEKGAQVEFLLNDQVSDQKKADDNGSFSFEGVLILGQNRVQLRAKDERGNQSMSEVSLVTYDNQPIVLVVSSPSDGSEYFGKNNQVVDIKGEVDKKNVQVLVNNSFVSVKSDGTFVHRFMLNNGENIVTIKASDEAGNSAEKSIKLVYTP